MHTSTTLKLPNITGVHLLTAFAFCICASAYAEPGKPAGAAAGNLPVMPVLSAAKGLSLKLDLAALDPEDCDEETDLMVRAAPPQQLAKLTTPANVNALRARGNALRMALSDADGGTAAAKSMPPPLAPPGTAPAPAPALAWEIYPSDKTLNSALARWAAAAGWQLVWELPVDYAVEARTTVRGSFEEAVGIVARSMDSAELPLKAVFYGGNKVLRIVSKGVE